MPRMTLIARVSDGLALAASTDDDQYAGPQMDEYKKQARKITQLLSANAPETLTIESGNSYFLYLITKSVCYLTLCDRSYPKKLALSFLEELSKEFDDLYGSQVEAATRPYHFIKFDQFILKTKKLYSDTRAQRNLQALNSELYEVQKIMTRNIEEVLAVGEKLDVVSHKSSQLAQESRKYADSAAELNFQMLLRQYGPPGVIAFIVLIVMYFFW